MAVLGRGHPTSQAYHGPWHGHSCHHSSSATTIRDGVSTGLSFLPVRWLFDNPILQTHYLNYVGCLILVHHTESLPLLPTPIYLNVGVNNSTLTLFLYSNLSSVAIRQGSKPQGHRKDHRSSFDCTLSVEYLNRLESSRIQISLARQSLVTSSYPSTTDPVTLFLALELEREVRQCCVHPFTRTGYRVNCHSHIVT